KDIPKNINYISNKYTSIDNNKKKDSITSHFQYKNYRNQNDLNSYSNLNDIRKSNTALNKNKIVSITQMNKDKIQNKNNINKIQHYNSYVITNKDNYKYNNNISYNETNRGKNNFIKITKHCRVTLDDPLRDREHGTIAVTEGKYHQIKRMFLAVGSEILSLERTVFAGIPLDPALAPGEWRPLSEDEIALLHRNPQTGGPHGHS
ncbi:MAG: hypothetical protein II650_08340, partial [Clostridia bacterium]|nr:hypothetical protein [Clostridia bacterium]